MIVSYIQEQEGEAPLTFLIVHSRTRSYVRRSNKQGKCHWRGPCHSSDLRQQLELFTLQNFWLIRILGRYAERCHCFFVCLSVLLWHQTVWANPIKLSWAWGLVCRDSTMMSRLRSGQILVCLGRSRQSNSSISSGVGTGNCERTGGLRGAWLCVDPVLTTSLLIWSPNIYVYILYIRLNFKYRLSLNTKWCNITYCTQYLYVYLAYSYSCIYIHPHIPLFSKPGSIPSRNPVAWIIESKAKF